MHNTTNKRDSRFIYQDEGFGYHGEKWDHRVDGIDKVDNKLRRDGILSDLAYD